MNYNSSRRNLLLASVLGGIAAASCSSKRDSGDIKLNPNDPAAGAVGYVEDATKADVSRFPTYSAGQSCANCLLIRQKYGFFRPCSLFPNHLVSAKGWCSAWAPQSQK